MTRGRIIVWILMLACTCVSAILIGISIWTITLRGAGLAQADLGLLLALALYGLPVVAVLIASFCYMFLTIPEPRAVLLIVKQPLGMLWSANVVVMLAVTMFAAAVMMFGYFWLQ